MERNTDPPARTSPSQPPREVPTPPPRVVPNPHAPAGRMPEEDQYPTLLAGVDIPFPPIRPFPVPLLYPLVKEITSSPDTLGKTKELPDPCPFIAPYDRAPSMTAARRQPLRSSPVPPAQREQPSSRQGATNEPNVSDPETLKQLKEMFPTFDSSIL